MNVEFEQQIRNRAYEIWEREGYPDGRALAHWEQAAKEVDQLLCAAIAPAVKAAPASKKSPKKAAAPGAATKPQRRNTRAHQSLN